MDAVFVASPTVVFRALSDEGGGVLLHLGTGAYHGLNRTGALIWGQLDGLRPVSEIASGIEASLPDAPADLSDQIQAFLSELLDRDLVVPAGAA